MKTLALCALAGNDIISIYSDRGITLVSVHNRTIYQGMLTFHSGAIGNGPFHTTLIDRVIRTFGLAGSAIDTFFGYLDSHNSDCLFGS
jgi:hypothetical protein